MPSIIVHTRPRTYWTKLDFLMARRVRGAGLETRSSRLKLQIMTKPVFVKIGVGIGLGYRRNATAGSWVVRLADGKGGYRTDTIATADDFAEADWKEILTFWQAQDRARATVQSGDGSTAAKNYPPTVAEALDEYW